MFYDPFANTRITIRIAMQNLHWSLSTGRKTMRKVITIDTPLTGGENSGHDIGSVVIGNQP
jgi:hypothetical protein